MCIYNCTCAYCIIRNRNIQNLGKQKGTYTRNSTYEKAKIKQIYHAILFERVHFIDFDNIFIGLFIKIERKKQTVRFRFF